VERAYVKRDPLRQSRQHCVAAGIRSGKVVGEIDVQISLLDGRTLAKRLRASPSAASLFVCFRLVNAIERLVYPVEPGIHVLDKANRNRNPRFRYTSKHASPVPNKTTDSGSGIVFSVPAPDAKKIFSARFPLPPPVSVPRYESNAPVPPITVRVCVKGTIGGEIKSSCSWRSPKSVSPVLNVIVNVPLASPVAGLGSLIMSIQVMLPSGFTEPAPTPIIGGFSGSPETALTL
jgi:hypothetical protein